jgi:SAM-dependent methyltransferase
MIHELFGAYAHRYDLHTPPDHYQHDHQAVIDFARQQGPNCKLLDVGCGTGVLLAKARSEGIIATGIDASQDMVRVSEGRAGRGAALVQRMQDLDDGPTYDLVVSLSWSINYCESREVLIDVLRRVYRALLPGGLVLLQVAHAAHVHGDVLEDHEPGPDASANDVTFLYRFQAADGPDHPMLAEYVYACKSTRELLYEQHLLKMADAHEVAECLRGVGFRDVELFDSWRREPFQRSPNPFISGHKA